MPLPDVETQQAASLHYVLPTHRVTAYTTNKKGGCLGNRPFGIIIPLYIYTPYLDLSHASTLRPMRQPGFTPVSLTNFSPTMCS